ncbi:MAG: hypothetical protein WBX25_14025 [Rhodomicrobium sp.]
MQRQGWRREAPEGLALRRAGAGQDWKPIDTQGISKAALFEDMVAERLDTLQRRGVKLELV